MKPIKLKVKTLSHNYSIIIGSNVVKDLPKYFKENSINYEKCLLIIDEKIPKKMISKIIKSLKRKKIYKFLFNANEKNKNQKSVNKILKLLLSLILSKFQIFIIKF